MVFEALDFFFLQFFLACWNFKYLVQKFLIHIKKQGKKKIPSSRKLCLNVFRVFNIMKMIVHLIRKSNFCPYVQIFSHNFRRFHLFTPKIQNPNLTPKLYFYKEQAIRPGSL